MYPVYSWIFKTMHNYWNHPEYHKITKKKYSFSMETWTLGLDCALDKFVNTPTSGRDASEVVNCVCRASCLGYSWYSRRIIFCDAQNKHSGCPLHLKVLSWIMTNFLKLMKEVFWEYLRRSDGDFYLFLMISLLVASKCCCILKVVRGLIPGWIKIFCWVFPERLFSHLNFVLHTWPWLG